MPSIVVANRVAESMEIALNIVGPLGMWVTVLETDSPDIYTDEVYCTTKDRFSRELGRVELVTPFDSIVAELSSLKKVRLASVDLDIEAFKKAALAKDPNFFSIDLNGA